MAGLKLTNIHKSFGTTQVIKDVTLDIQDGEFIVFVGPSGCGKSTLLRIIAGLEDITSGELEIGGRLVNQLEPKERGIAMVFQNYAIFPHMSVRENMAFGLTIQGASAEEKHQRVAEAARVLKMEDLLDRRPSQLSGGQRQRVAIGRAIVRNPEVFLFDEPLSNLDAALRMNTRSEIAELHKRLRTTMIYVTHDQVEAMTMADRIVVLKDGQVQQFGKPMELFNHPANQFVAKFIGSPPMNLFAATLIRTNNGSLSVDCPALGLLPLEKLNNGRSLAQAVLKENQPVTLGLRPQYIHLTKSPDTNLYVNARVEFSERLGTETAVGLRLDKDKKIIAMLSHDIELSNTDSISLFIDSSRMHVFSD